MSSIDPATVALCTPTYDSKLGVLYVMGLTEVLANRALAMPYFQAGCSHVGLARNRCAHWFLKTPYQHLVFVDADIGFRLSDWMALLEDDGSECVCAPYRKKDQREAIRVHMGLGFARISRPVFAALDALRDEAGADLLRRFRMDGEEWVDYFPSGVGMDAHWRGEDHGFWLLAKVTGAQVRIEERCRLVHSGEAHWVYRTEDFPNEESPYGRRSADGYVAPPEPEPGALEGFGSTDPAF